MSSQNIERFEGDEITDDLLVAAAKFFSENYGIWGPLAAENMSKAAKQGTRVKMSAKRLREQILPSRADSVYIRIMAAGQLVANVFGTRWIDEDNRQMLWITQLCVSKQHRNQGIAKSLLENLGQNEEAVGILSSHPFAISAVLRVFDRGLDDVDLEITKKHAAAVMKSCPVGYVQSAELRGTLFGPSDNDDGALSCADTKFWVDHGEPLEALETIRSKGIVWPLGELPDGHEFVILVKSHRAFM